MTPGNRTEYIRVYVSPQEKREIKDKADDKGFSASRFLREEASEQGSEAEA